MKRVDSVISLIYSMSKAEKKAFSVQMLKDKEEKDYLVIYDIITKSKWKIQCKLPPKTKRFCPLVLK